MRMTESRLFRELCEDYYERFGNLSNEKINELSRSVFKSDIPEPEELVEKWQRNKGLSALKQIKNEDGVSVWDSTPDRDGYYKITKTESAYKLKSSFNTVVVTVKGCEKKMKLIEYRLGQVRMYFDELGNVVDIESPSMLIESVD